MTTPHSCQTAHPVLRAWALLCSFVIFHSAFDIACAAPPPELTVLRQQYEKVFAERVTAVHEANVATLDAKFTTALDNAIATAKSAGDLPTVLAIQGDKKLLAEKQPLPTDDDQTPEPLKKLRAIYRDQLARLTEQKTANATALLTPYAAKLQALEATLTKNDRVDEAKEVMDYRVGLKADAPTAPAVAVTTPAAPGTTPPMPANTAPQVKGDDRKAAEWVLSVGGTVRMMDRGNEVVVQKTADIPRGAAELIGIGINAESQQIQPFDAAALEQLAGLTNLRNVFLGFRDMPMASAPLRFLATCPKIETLRLWYNKPDPTLIDHLAPLGELKELAIAYSKITGGPIHFSRLLSKDLVEINFGSTNIDNATLIELAGQTKIERVNLENTPITDAGIAALKGMTKLTQLKVGQSKVTAEGLRALQGIKLTTLSFGSEDPAQYTEVGRLFPSVTYFEIYRSGKASDKVFAVLAAGLPQLEILELREGKLTDPACTALTSFKKLTELRLPSTDLTDEAIPAIAEIKNLVTLNIEGTHLTDKGLEKLQAMKKLKTLKLPKPGNGLTAEGIAKFKKQRPDVKLN